MLKMDKSPAQKDDGQIPVGAAGKRAYAIGDVHGCHDLLLRLLEKIRLHDESRPECETHIILVGDLIDRGPKSRQVVDYLIHNKPEFGTYHFIKGNHEEILVRIFNGDGSLLNMWLAHGGWQTIQSYGATSRDFRDLSTSESIQLLNQMIPAEHIEFFKTFDDGIEFGDYFFTHAGVRPGVALTDQAGKDLRWIRDGFLDSNEDFGSVIVHGHSISENVTIKRNRVGIDTGAYISGKLSAFWIEELESGILDVETETSLGSA